MTAFKLDDLLRQGAAPPRRAARWVQEHLPEVDARAIGRGGQEVIDWLQAHLPKGAAPPEIVRIERRRASDAASLLWPTFLAAAGAGAAFWWWTQWSRGRAEADRARLGGEEGAAHPEDILAHAPPPPDVAGPLDTAPAPSVAPEAVLAHAPPPADVPAGKGKSKASGKSKPKKVEAVVAPKAEAALRRNLAVQADDGSPAPAGPRGEGS